VSIVHQTVEVNGVNLYILVEVN